MSEQVLNIETTERVSLIKFNRPEAANAFDGALRAATSEALLEAGGDDAIGAVVLSGEGRSFCAGIDLRELADLAGRDMGGFAAGASASEASAAGASASDQAAPQSGDTWNLLQVLESFPKPLIMAVNGSAVGLGTTMLGYADLVFASEQARFKCPFTELGVGAEAASTWLLPKLMGWQNAMWLLLSSQWVNAAQAKELGLVFQVCEPEALIDQALAAAQTIASQDLASAVAIKEAMLAWRRGPVEQALGREGAAFMELIASKGGG